MCLFRIFIPEWINIQRKSETENLKVRIERRSDRDEGGIKGGKEV